MSESIGFGSEWSDDSSKIGRDPTSRQIEQNRTQQDYDQYPAA